jgi:glycine cleavage system H protein
MTLDQFIAELPAHDWFCPENDLWLRPLQGGNWQLGANAIVAKFGKFMVFYPKEQGLHIDAKESLGVMETWKTALGIPCPAPATLVCANQAVVSDINLVAQSPYDQGWLFQIRPDDESVLRSRLMQKDDYVAWLKVHGEKQFAAFFSDEDPADLIYDPLRGI